MEKLKMHSPDLTAENVKRLKELFPTVVTEATDEEGNPAEVVDLDLLRQELFDHVVDGPKERYQLDWPGKRAALFAANAPIAKTLRPVREESVDFDVTKNLFIEGDNLDALKLLQESYLGKVKLIYIDPPYNTGNDFVYDDDFAESTAEYLERSGQVSDKGERLVANTESNGRFHSDWLSMMYPRLKLARNLLRDDGLIFVSISDMEGANLRALMDEVFGRANFVENFVWESIFRPSNMSRRVRRNAEYILCYARDASQSFEFIERLEDTQGDASLTQANNAERMLQFPASIVVTGLPDGRYPKGVREGVVLENDLVVENGLVVQEFALSGRFKWQQEYLDAEIEKGVLLQIKSESMIPYYRKIYQQTTLRPRKILPRDLVGDVLQANAEISALFGEVLFDYPKPTSLIAFLIRMCGVAGNDIVLDFFAGSGSTAHAVLQANASDGGHRRFIVVQIDEDIPSGSAAAVAGFANVAQLAMERIRRAGAAIGQDPASAAPLVPSDNGFRMLRVDSSNKHDVLHRADGIDQANLGLLVDHFKPDRTAEDLLFEVLLDWGLEVTMPIEVERVEDTRVFVAEDGALIGCFDSDVGSGVVREIATRRPLRAVFLDAGYSSDADRINAEQIFAEVSPTTDVKVI